MPENVGEIGHDRRLGRPAHKGAGPRPPLHKPVARQPVKRAPDGGAGDAVLCRQLRLSRQAIARRQRPVRDAIGKQKIDAARL